MLTFIAAFKYLHWVNAKCAVYVPKFEIAEIDENAARIARRTFSSAGIVATLLFS